MPTVAPQPVAFCPSPWPGSFTAGSRRDHRSARRPRFSAVTGSRNSDHTRARDRGCPIMRLLSLPVVQFPVVVVVVEVDLTLSVVDRLLLFRGNITSDECGFPATPVLEVFSEPETSAHDLRGADFERITLLAETRAEGPIKKIACLIVELGVDAIAHEGFRAQRRAALGGAIDSKMNARILEALADLVVLDVVQRDLSAAEWHPRRFEHVELQEVSRDIPDRFHGIVLDDRADHVDVVEIHPVRLLLLLVQRSDVHLAQVLA